jgi:lipopolysaccharide transport system ATP-binding protein
MSNTVIKTENLGKRYHLGVIGTGTLTHDLQSWWARFKGVEDPNTKIIHKLTDPQVKKLNRNTSQKYKHGDISNYKLMEDEYVWALKEVTFKVSRGEALGIIGPNGAGKSTLLKILSRVTVPTSGQIQVKGRIASLLEVGTGFHPELTGRENIFLNGAILGMKKTEIKQKFDEIVEFAEIDKFLDTPVKRYSSGMYVRLAFAVAAHLESEILIVDEVLAVGDGQFQDKCLGKMNDVSKSGKTVLFVSHNMNAIERLCTNCILLEEGRIKEHGTDVRSIISNYLFGSNERLKTSVWENIGNKIINDYFKPSIMYISDIHGIKSEMPLSNDKDFYLNIIGETKELNPILEISYVVYNEDNYEIYASSLIDKPMNKTPKLKCGSNHLRTKIPKRFLNEGTYRITLCICLHNQCFICDPLKNEAYILISIKGGLSDSPFWIERRVGVMAPVLDWEIIN